MSSLKHFWLWLKAEYRWRILGKRYVVSMSEKAQSKIDALPEEEQEEIKKFMEHLSRNPYIGRRVDLEDE